MLKQIEATDRDTGKTTCRISFKDNCLGPMLERDTSIDENYNLTVGTVLAYASHVWESLIWINTDNGKRATVRYGRYDVYLYQY